MQNALLYATTVLIWGTTWIAIKFQIGIVDPTLSVSYRFAIASLLLFLICLVQGKASTLKFSPHNHLYLAGLGAFIFCLNYILIYWGSAYITSGLVALCFSTLPVFNAINQRIFFKTPLDHRVIQGSILGLIGIATVFGHDLTQGIGQNHETYIGIGLCLLSTFTASLGNMFSARNSKHGLPVLATSAYGMAYGATFSFIAAVISSTPITFDPTLPYTASLLYLSVFGSAAAFLCYLTLVKNIGSDRAGYSAILFPIVALTISTFFEGYEWTVSAIIGVVLILCGNILALRRKNALRSRQSRA